MFFQANSGDAARSGRNEWCVVNFPGKDAPAGASLSIA